MRITPRPRDSRLRSRLLFCQWSSVSLAIPPTSKISEVIVVIG